MCGIAGFWYPEGVSDPRQKLQQMGDAITHRGPDDWGWWADDQRGLGFVHRRLSILDLSKLGSQPMMSASGRYVIIYNGELYNHQELKRQISCPWEGHCDTEIVLAAIENWGVGKALEAFEGMFAFALWDKHTQTLTLARDRLGEKPLYYGCQNGALLFASDLAAIKVNDSFVGDLNSEALSLYLRHNCVPAPYSIYRDIYKLIPGSYWQISQSEIRENIFSGAVSQYWCAREIAENGQQNLYSGTDEEAIERLHTLVNESVMQQMVADVPVGALLSGGVDSSSVAALMQKNSAKPIDTFSIGFDEKDFNEAVYAKGVANHIGSTHHELYVNGAQALDVVPRLPGLYTEPFSDPSQIPFFLLSQMARQSVTVALSGDGGDELFGGYNRYYLMQSIWHKISWVPRPLRAALAGIITFMPPKFWSGIFKGMNSFLPGKLHHLNFEDKLVKLTGILPVKSPDEIYIELISQWKKPSQIAIQSNEPLTLVTDPKQWPKVDDLVHSMMYLDMVSYLPDDILTKVDRASMGVSLETRIPLLDKKIVEFAWKLPNTMKFRDGQTKWILRQLLNRYVPDQLIERPKMGFGVPLDLWLRGPLREWAEDLLCSKTGRTDRLLEMETAEKYWRAHLTGRVNHAHKLWNILMFVAWERENA